MLDNALLAISFKTSNLSLLFSVIPLTRIPIILSSTWAKNIFNEPFESDTSLTNPAAAASPAPLISTILNPAGVASVTNCVGTNMSGNRTS